MIAFAILRRLSVAALQLAAITLIVFVVMRALPADPVARLAGDNATPEAYARTRHQLGLDKPVLQQLADYAGLGAEPGILQGNLGTSWVSGRSVQREIADYLPITVELITLSIFTAFLVSLPIGMLCALRPGGIGDRLAYAYSLFAGAQPEFWWGILFTYIFFIKLGWAPPPLGRLDPLTDAPPVVTGSILIDSLVAGRLDAFSDGAAHLMLPVATKVFVLSGPLVKMIRQSMVRILDADFILYKRAMGLSPIRVALYALRNALPPTVTLIGVLYGYILGGAVLIETIFSLGGIGQYAVRSVLSFDYPAVQGVVLVITAVSLLVYLCLDIVQTFIDPRFVL